MATGSTASYQGGDDVAFAGGIGPERDRALPVAGQDVGHPASHPASLGPAESLLRASAAVPSPATHHRDNLMTSKVEEGSIDPVSRLAAVARTDVVLVGAGIMSATLGALLRRLEPDWSITADRTAGRRRRREQRPLEQRRHRALRAVRAELHPGNARRLDRHHQSGAHQRAIPGDPPILGVRRRERHPDRLAASSTRSRM